MSTGPRHYTTPIDLQPLGRLVPEAEFWPGDPGQGTLSVPVAGYTEVAMLQDGSVWFNESSASHTVLREERVGQVDPGLPPEEAAVEFRKLVIEAVKKYLSPDEEFREILQGEHNFTPDPVQPDWASQPGRDPDEGYWHYTPEDLESDSFG